MVRPGQPAEDRPRFPHPDRSERLRQPHDQRRPGLRLPRRPAWSLWDHLQQRQRQLRKRRRPGPALHRIRYGQSYPYGDDRGRRQRRCRQDRHPHRSTSQRHLHQIGCGYAEPRGQRRFRSGLEHPPRRFAGRKLQYWCAHPARNQRRPDPRRRHAAAQRNFRRPDGNYRLGFAEFLRRRHCQSRQHRCVQLRTHGPESGSYGAGYAHRRPDRQSRRRFALDAAFTIARCRSDLRPRHRQRQRQRYPFADHRTHRRRPALG